MIDEDHALRAILVTRCGEPMRRGPKAPGGVRGEATAIVSGFSLPSRPTLGEVTVAPPTSTQIAQGSPGW